MTAHMRRLVRAFAGRTYHIVGNLLPLLNYVLDAQKNRLIETILMSTHNKYFSSEIKKMIFNYAPIWRPQYIL